MYQKLSPEYVAEKWECWCGETAWSKAMREFASLGGMVTWYCGYPQSASAIPLTFTLHRPNGEQIETGGSSRLRDIREAIRQLKGVRPCDPSR